MPIISIFFGIVIRINFSDHNPPHLHADHQGHEALFDIRTGEMIAGDLPRAARRLVSEWITLNRAALAENWDRAYSDRATFRIPGLDRQ